MKINLIRISAFFMLILLFAGCRKNQDRKIEEILDSEYLSLSNTEESESVRYTVNYNGTYTGMLPCADCKGIYTELTLQDDNYTMRRVYRDVINSDTITDTGKISWEGSGNVIILQLVDMPNTYEVRENELVALDEDGHLVTDMTADEYILRKK